MRNAVEVLQKRFNMKKYFIQLAMLSGIILGFALSGSAQVYVHERPTAPRMDHKPPSPGRGYVWINEDWNPRGSSYEYAGGHWAKPTHPGSRWVAGSWHRHGKDWAWTPGRWKR
jgi:hypothetical protein